MIDPEVINISGFTALYIFMLSAFTGYEVISRVPVILHTPMMSGSNFYCGYGQCVNHIRADHRLFRCCSSGG